MLSFQYSQRRVARRLHNTARRCAEPGQPDLGLGDAYQTNAESGPMSINNAQLGGLGAIEASSLESSTVDLATELTNMIQAQSAYEANSKVFQTGTDIFDVLNNLKS